MSALVTGRLEEWLPTTEPGLSAGFPLISEGLLRGLEADFQSLRTKVCDKFRATYRTAMPLFAVANLDQHFLAASLASDVAMDRVCWLKCLRWEVVGVRHVLARCSEFV